MFFLHVCLGTVCVPVPMNARRHQIYYDWNYRELPCGYLELNPGHLKYQPVLLSAESSVQPLKTIFKTANHLLVYVFFNVFTFAQSTEFVCVCVCQTMLESEDKSSGRQLSLTLVDLLVRWISVVTSLWSRAWLPKRAQCSGLLSIAVLKYLG